MLNIYKKKIKFNSKNYLIKCDQIQKYNFKNINQIISIKSIHFNLTLEEANKVAEENFSSEISEELKMKSFLLFFILFSFLPFINFYASKISKEKNFALILILSKRKDIDSFLETFFFDNILPLYKENFSFFINSQSKEEKFVRKNCTLNIKVPASAFTSINDLILDSNINLNTKETYLNINFSLKNLSSLILTKNELFFRNLPYFWHIKKQKLNKNFKK